ncbi:hypothetical protein Bca52824_012548 [Brassica carinata]|uniref:Uncharacterized protein n=1 Tax=Brassica carinata TaxID=52824 RepID=A0A8X7VZ49_BRACI|nr:hypothetical protein Bca52824_012548 [Brassica carinata]
MWRRHRRRSHSLRYGRRVSARSGTGGSSSSLVSSFSFASPVFSSLSLPCRRSASGGPSCSSLLLGSSGFSVGLAGSPLLLVGSIAWRRFGCLICSAPVGSLRAVVERRVAANR